ncbi:virulence factor, partial [Achromobacter ruhlandii]|nr:virulence factor [Achromobacter ruhlandii]
PVYYRPAPVYVAPPVVYPAPVYIRGGGYWGPHGHWRGPDRGYYHGRGGWHR